MHAAWFWLRFGGRARAEVLDGLSGAEVALIAAIENDTAGYGSLAELIERHAGPFDPNALPAHPPEGEIHDHRRTRPRPGG